MSKNKYPEWKDDPDILPKDDMAKWTLAKLRRRVKLWSHKHLILSHGVYCGLHACTGKETYDKRGDIVADEIERRLREND